MDVNDTVQTAIAIFSNLIKNAVTLRNAPCGWALMTVVFVI